MRIATSDTETRGRGDAEMFVVDLVADVVVGFVLDLLLAIVPRVSLPPCLRVAVFIRPDRANTPVRRQSCRGSQS